MVHEEDLKNAPLSNEELYRMKYNKLSACIHKLKDHLLGENWYIADAVDGTTACEIITDEICSRYRNVNKSRTEWFAHILRKHEENKRNNL